MHEQVAGLALRWELLHACSMGPAYKGAAHNTTAQVNKSVLISVPLRRYRCLAEICHKGYLSGKRVFIGRTHIPATDDCQGLTFDPSAHCIAPYLYPSDVSAIYRNSRI